MTIIDNLKSKIDSSGNLVLGTDFLKETELNNFIKAFNMTEFKITLKTEDPNNFSLDNNIVTINGFMDLLESTQVPVRINLSTVVLDKYSFDIKSIFTSMSLDIVNKYVIKVPEMGILGAAMPLAFKDTCFKYHSINEEIYFGCLNSEFSIDCSSSIGLALNKLGFEVTKNQAQNSFGLVFHASIELEENEIDVVLSFQFDLNMNVTDILISLENQINLSKGINDVIGFLSNKLKSYFSNYDFSKLLPDKLISMNFMLTDFQLSFDVAAVKPSYIYFEVCSEEGFPIYDNVQLTSTGVGIDISFSDNTSISTSFFGGIKIDDALTFNVELQIPYPFTNDWALHLDGGVNLKNLSDLSKFPMVSSIDEFCLPKEIFSVNSLDVRRFNVEFNLNDKLIKGYDLDIFLQANFDIISGKVSLGNPELILMKSGDSSITGSLSCNTQISNVNFFVCAAKNATGWEFSGHSTDGNIDLKSIITYLSPVDFVFPSQFELKLDSMGWDIKSNLFNIYSNIEFDFGFGNEKCSFNFSRSTNNDSKDYRLWLEYFVNDTTFFDLTIDDSTDFILTGELKSNDPQGCKLDINNILSKIGKSLGNIEFPKVDSIILNSALIEFNKTQSTIKLEGMFNNNLNLLLVLQKGSSWDFTIAIDYSKDMKLSDIMGLKMPDFIDIKDIFIAYSTSSQQFTFTTKNKTRPSMTLTQDSLSLGAVVGISGQAGEFAQNLIGNELDTFISGSINVKSLALDLIAQLQSVGERKPFSNKTCYPSLNFKNFKVEIKVVSDNITLSFACDVEVSINGTSLLLDGRISIEENQFEISASLKGDPIEIPLLAGYKFEFNDIAFELGDGYELEDPVIGYTGEVTFADFNAFEAILLDSAEPQNCMVAASMNKLPALALAQLLAKLCADFDKSLSFLNVLQGISISGTKITDITATDIIISELNRGDKCPEIANELKIHDYVITQGKDANDLWFMRDENTAKIYQIKKENDQLTLSNELQIYVVPNTQINIGNITFYQGLRLNGCINLFGYQIKADVDISPKGIIIDADCDPLNLYVVQFVSSKDDSKGPKFSLNTIDNPHIYLDGKISLLGLSEAIHAEISETGLSFQLTTDLDVFKSAITVTSNKWTDLQLQSAVDFALSVTTPNLSIDGVTILPSEQVSIDISGGVLIYIDSSSCNCMLAASADLCGQSIYRFSSDDKIKIDKLSDLASCVGNWIINNAEKVFESILNDVNLFSNLVKNGIISLGEGLANALRKFPGLGDVSVVVDVAEKLKDLIPGIGDNEIVANLKNALYTDQAISDGLHAVESSTEAAAEALKTVLNITDANVLRNLLTASGFSDVESVIDNLFSCSCFLNVCPLNCPANCAVNCPVDCPVNCVVNCPLNCVLDCPFHCIIHL